MKFEEQHNNNVHTKKYTSVITFKETEETENTYDLFGWKFVKVVYQKITNNEYLVEVCNASDNLPWCRKFNNEFDAYELYASIVSMPVVNISKLNVIQFKKMIPSEETI